MRVAAAFASVALAEGRYTQAARSAAQLAIDLAGIVAAAIAVLLFSRGRSRRRGRALSAG
jgi:hypothetical protein